ncbi:MAG TPA: HAD hydrolase-like protein [Anaerolineae bacterium]|mgnify:CR=1 FL=1|nr:HAD hydrolase-like protein [Anaerolineae bacterium]
MNVIPKAANVLVEFQPKQAFFVGIDSDGCAFDAMEIKHKECFTPNTIKHWQLQPVSKYARETAEFVNLYSKWRGGNRWPSLIKVFDLLAEREEVLARGVNVPQAEKLREFIASGYPLSDTGLQDYMTRHPHPELEQGLAWTTGVNKTIADMVSGVPPFPFVRESLQKMQGRVDLMVVSATPVEALEREWQEHDLAQYMAVIAGQEMGTKAQHLQFAAKGKYPADHILLIGDAPGDRDAAHAVNALYYPINPGYEDKSWQRFYDEALDKFLNGAYAGAYEAALIAEFEKLLPETPPWRK